MSTASTDRPLHLNEFFAASEARVDRWRTLNRIAKALAGTGSRASLAEDPKTLLADLVPLEELCGYPGPRLMARSACFTSFLESSGLTLWTSGRANAGNVTNAMTRTSISD